MSILVLWLLRGALGETAGTSSLQREIITRDGNYIQTRDGSILIGR